MRTEQPDNKVTPIWPKDDPRASKRCHRTNGAIEDTEDILADVESFLKRFVVLPEVAYLVVAVWCLATHLAAEFAVFPYLNLNSPEKRCGKTRVLEVLELLCARPYLGVAPSPAALFRSMQDCPTLLLDEVDQIFKSRAAPSESQQALVAILNAGYKRGATVLRCDGPSHQPRKFPVFGPKAFASIGPLPGTISDRSIDIRMQRKPAKQKVERFLGSRMEPEARPFRERIARWAAANSNDIRRVYEKMPDLEFISDRDAEIWLVLFAVCSVAGPERMQDLQQAAKTLCDVKDAADGDDSTSLHLLRDIREVWPRDKTVVFTIELLECLFKLEESPWRDYDWSDRKMARTLRGYGIASRTVRVEDNTRKGYVRSDFEDAWTRYLSPLPSTSGPVKEESSVTSVTTRVKID